MQEIFRTESHTEGHRVVTHTEGHTGFPESCQEFGKCEHRLSSKECPKESNQESDHEEIYRSKELKFHSEGMGSCLPQVNGIFLFC